MKTAITKLPDEKAQKELKKFLIIGYICAIITPFALGFLAIVSLGCGARCIALSNHAGNKKLPNAGQLKWMSIGLFVVGVVGSWLYIVS